MEAMSQSLSASAVAPSPSLQAINRKKKRVAGNPDPDAEVIALSEDEILTPHGFHCEACGKSFHREQNLQLHMRGHNLPWRLKKSVDDQSVRKKVYVCPDPLCVHHRPERALRDLTGIKKHFGRKHGEKKWNCGKCSKSYAVEGDCKAHEKMCGSKEYRCNSCETNFARRDSFINHRGFCQALAEARARMGRANQEQAVPPPPPPFNPPTRLFHFLCPSISQNPNPNPLSPLHLPHRNPNNISNPPLYSSLGQSALISFQNQPLRPFSSPPPIANLTATGQLPQETSIFIPKAKGRFFTPAPRDMAHKDLMDNYHDYDMRAPFMQRDEDPTRDFLGRINSLSCENNENGDDDQGSMNMKDLLVLSSTRGEHGVTKP